MVNWLGILIAAASTLVVGMLWYGPLFGNRWMKLMGFTAKQISEGKKKGMAGMWKQMAAGFLAGLVKAYVLVMFFQMVAVGFSTAAYVAGMIWLGFLATNGLNSVLWEGRSLELYFLNVFASLAELLVMTAILTYFV